MEKHMKLEGRCAVITGASQGLGKAIARQFLQEGASIIICSNNEVAITETVAEELKGKSIDVNAMAPGALKTNLTEKFVAGGPEKIGAGFHQKISAILKDGGTPFEVGAECAVYLASKDSDGISGKLIAA